MKRSRQSRPRYKSRLIKGRVSLLVSMLLMCSSSLSDSESLCPEPRSSLILLLVLLACSLWSLSLTCNKVSLHFRVVRPGMWQEYTTAQDRRPRPHTHKTKFLQKAVVRQLVLFYKLDQESRSNFLDLNSFFVWTYFFDLNLVQNL
jgi:hypothetical protein